MDPVRSRGHGLERGLGGFVEFYYKNNRKLKRYTDRDLLLNGMDDNNRDIIRPFKRIPRLKILNIFLVGIFVVFFVYVLFLIPFRSEDTTIHIAQGQSIDSIAKELETKHVVRDDLTLKFFVKILKSGKGIITGDYLIEKNSPVWVVAWQIGRGHHNLESLKVTIREGLTNEEIALLLTEKLTGFNKDLFLSATLGKQGYLFPDTYFLYPLDTTEEIINKLSDNFNNKIKTVSSEIKSSGKSLKDIITLASILEGEASGKDDIYIISGILWKRINMGMPLQVDIAPDTYKEKGLPANPINNPGLLSIKAAINPEDSSYLYYLHDGNGIVHFAKSFEEHKQNISKYLK